MFCLGAQKCTGNSAAIGRGTELAALGGTMASPVTRTFSYWSASTIALATLLAVLWMPTTAWAQSPTGTITGHVSDAQGKSVAGAAVTVESPNLQQAQKTTSAPNGDYIFKLLPPGQYTATFQLTGFAPVKMTLTVAAAEPVTLNAMLRPAAQAETSV